MSENFAFLEGINPKFYSALEKIERNARIKPQEAARDCRALLEIIVDEIFQRYRIEPGKDLNENLTIWTNDRRIKSLCSQKVKYDAINKQSEIKEEEDPGLFYTKFLGNSNVHGGESFNRKGVRPILSAEAIIKALEVFHEILCKYYREQISDDPKFSKVAVPLGGYKIEQMKKPTDSDRSKCIREYVATRNRGTATKNIVHALIREYDPKELDELTLNRSIDTFQEMYDRLNMSGMHVESLNHTDDQNAGYFIVYEFRQPFQPLQSFLKKNRLLLKDRIKLCLKIARTIESFHTAPDPVYHRMLSYDCIVVSETENEQDKYMPFITKFDFAKITSLNGATVFKHLSEAQEIESIKLARYRVDNIAPDSLWDKVDIYSLGVLFVDILMNSISTKEISVNTFEELTAQGVSENMQDLIDHMLNGMPNERPDIVRVCETIEAESVLNE